VRDRIKKWNLSKKLQMDGLSNPTTCDRSGLYSLGEACFLDRKTLGHQSLVLLPAL